mmetsp:Transcript_46993/g.110673  ORF Transcript_46993/g.110673 Transcript_46993/m.110673 type:complete len:215 (-) Transcript_46993:1078-1722(-)
MWCTGCLPSASAALSPSRTSTARGTEGTHPRRRSFRTRTDAPPAPLRIPDVCGLPGGCCDSSAALSRPLSSSPSQPSRSAATCATESPPHGQWCAAETSVSEGGGKLTHASPDSEVETANGNPAPSSQLGESGPRRETLTCRFATDDNPQCAFLGHPRRPWTTTAPAERQRPPLSAAQATRLLQATQPWQVTQPLQDALAEHRHRTSSAFQHQQ